MSEVNCSSVRSERAARAVSVKSERRWVFSITLLPSMRARRSPQSVVQNGKTGMAQPIVERKSIDATTIIASTVVKAIRVRR